MIEEQLSLDIAKALASVDRVEAELTSAAKQFGVDLARAVDLLRDGVKLDVDTRGIATELSRAIATADTQVRATVDTTGIASQVTGAVDAADSHVAVTADTAQARREVDRLDDEVQEATRSTDLLRRALAGVSAAATVNGILAVADAGSDLAESTSKAQVVFEQGFARIDEFAAGAAESVGLSRQQALEATSTFGNLFQALGVTRSEATELSPAVVQLAGDLASFNNLDPTEALEKLRSGLVGEIEPLRSLGVSFTAVDVERRAFELGLASTNDELTEGDKVLARYNLIVEQTALAQGDFARTSEGLANQQRTLRGEFENVIGAAGERLTPQMQELVGVAREDLIPALGELAAETLPALVSIATDLTPVLGTTLDLLVAAAPLLQVTAEAVDAIPDPLLQIGAGLLVVNRSLFVLDLFRTKALAAATASAGLERTTRALSIPAGRLGGFLLAAAAVGSLADAALEAERPLAGVVGRITEFSQSVSGLGTNQAQRATEFATALIEGLNLSDLDDRRAAIERVTDELRELEETQGRGRVFTLGGVDAFATPGDAAREARIRGLREQLEVLQDLSRTEINAGVETGRWTRAQANAATVTAARAAGGRDVIGALEILRREEELAAAAAEKVLAAYDLAGVAVVNLNDDLSALKDTAPSVAGALLDLADGFDPDELTAFALGLESAALSADQLEQVARVLGITVDDLTGLVDAAGAALDNFVSTAVGNLPTVEDVLSDLAASSDRSSGRTGSAVDTVARRLENLRERALEARQALEEALQPASVTDLERAELGVDRARQRVVEAEAALAEARRLEFSTTGGRSLADRQRAIADAELDVREATLAVTDAEANLTAVRAEGTEVDEDVVDARRRVAEADREVADAQQEAAESLERSAGSARRAADEVQISARDFSRALLARAGDMEDFRTDLQALADAGFATLAGQVARLPAEVADPLADELQQALANGNLVLLKETAAAIGIFEAELRRSTDLFRDVLGPDMVLAALFTGDAVGAAFADGIMTPERIQVAMAVNASAFDQAGRAVVAVAAFEGEAAARAYGKALDLEAETIDAAVAAGLALQTHLPDGEAAGRSIGEGLARGIERTVDLVTKATRLAGDAVISALDEVFDFGSPSRVMEDFGRLAATGFNNGYVDTLLDPLALVAKVNSDGMRSGGVVTPPAPWLDDSRIVAALERLAADAHPPVGSVHFHGSPDPGRDLDLLRRRLKAGQR